jgi:type VI secretion system protein ImpA
VRGEVRRHGALFRKAEEPALDEVRHVVHGFLQKKREFEPDPVEEVPPPAAEPAPAPGERPQPERQPRFPHGSELHDAGAAEPADRSAAIAGVAAAAQFLRKREPFSPAPYLMLRGLRWGELRASSDPACWKRRPPRSAGRSRPWR